MSTSNDIWKKLENSKEYREEFALSLLKRSVAFQIKTLRKKRSGSQAVLAERAKLTQGVVSRAEDQNYGNLTFNTVGRIAGGLDMAFIGRFVPFSDLVRFSSELSESEFANIPTFDEEMERRSSEPVTATMTSVAIRNVLTDRAAGLSVPSPTTSNWFEGLGQGLVKATQAIVVTAGAGKTSIALSSMVQGQRAAYRPAFTTLPRTEWGRRQRKLRLKSRSSKGRLNRPKTQEDKHGTVEQTRAIG